MQTQSHIGVNANTHGCKRNHTYVYSSSHLRVQTSYISVRVRGNRFQQQNERGKVGRFEKNNVVFIWHNQ